MLDEVNAGLNPSEIDEALRMIRKIAEQGVTIVVIEHLMKVVLSISQRIVVLHHGQLIADGEPNAVLRDPKRDRGLSRLEIRRRACRRRRHEQAAKAAASRICRPAMATCRCCGTCRSTVAAGELVCLIGSNGAGKTTLLRCISGALRGHGRARSWSTARHDARVARPTSCSAGVAHRAGRTAPVLGHERARQPADGRLSARRQGGRRGRSRTRLRACSRSSPSGGGRMPARSRAASSRCARSAAA